MSDVSPTYTVSQAAYDRLVEERDQLRESYRAALELNTEIILGVKRVQAEAWDMGHAAAKGYDLSYELDRKEWEEEFALVRTTNPYREA